MGTLLQLEPDAGDVLCQPTLDVAVRFMLTQDTLAQVLRLSEASVSRLNPSRKTWELALLCIRVYPRTRCHLGRRRSGAELALISRHIML